VKLSISAVFRKVPLGTTIRTDGLNIYSGLGKLGFVHEATVAPGKTKDDVLLDPHGDLECKGIHPRHLSRLG
jgi:hypothetical protein